MYKKVYGIEEYLVKLNKNNHICLSKFRTGNNKLPVITSRYNQIDRKEEHCCTKCNDGLIGDEYHVLLQCQSQDIVQLRNKYIPEYYRLQPNHFKFVMLMQSRNVGLLTNLVQFINALLRMFK